MPSRLSFQLYSARNFPPLEKTFAMLARLGYREVEGYGDVYKDPVAVRTQLDVCGLSMPTGHFGMDMLENARPDVLRIVHTLGIRNVYAPYVPEEERPRSTAGWKEFGRRLASIGDWLRSEGVTFGWHNHDFEFRKLPSGEFPIDLIFAAAPVIDWECDVAWIARAGASPAKWIKRHAGRITAIHVKDMAPKGQNADEDGWADVGKGEIDWPSIMDLARKTRTLHYVMEHDNPSDLERFARRSFDYVSKL